MEFTSIFTEMSWVAAVLLVVGIVFIFIEILMPGFGFFGIAGGALVIAGTAVRIVQGLNLVQSLTLILLVIGVLIILFMLMVFFAKNGSITNGLFETKSTIPENFNKADKRKLKLIGKSGKSVTALNLGGKAKIDGKIYDVQSINSYIEQGAHVKVVEIKDDTIMVRKWFE